MRTVIEVARQLRFRFGKVVPVTTTAPSKEDGFGRLKMLLSQGRLALPCHPALLAQLSSLEYEERDSGSLKISVPEGQGHDDIAMALMLAVSEADVASLPQTMRFHVPTGNLPTAVIDRRAHMPPGEPAVEVVKEDQPRPADRLLQFSVAKRHPLYQRPGTWR